MDEPRTTLSGRWRVVVEEVLTGMADWRAAHPTAPFAELEVEVEARLGELRARMLEEAALARGADAAETEERPPCPACGGPLVARGQQTRQVRVRGDRQVALRRPYLTCTACGRGFFPPG